MMMMVLKIMIISANLAVACSLLPLFIQAFRLVVSFESSFSSIQVFRLLVKRFLSLVSSFSSLIFSDVVVGSFKQNFSILILYLIPLVKVLTLQSKAGWISKEFSATF